MDENQTEDRKDKGTENPVNPENSANSIEDDVKIYEYSGEERRRKDRFAQSMFAKKTSNWSKQDIHRGIILTIALCLVVVFMSLLDKIPVVFGWIGVFISALTPLIIGCAFAFLLNPIVKYFKKQFRKIIKKKKAAEADKLANTIAVIVTAVIFVGMIIALLAIILPQLKDSLFTLYEKLPGYFDGIKKWLNGVFSNSPEIQKTISQYMDNFQSVLSKLFSETLLPNMDSVISWITSGLMGFLTAVLDIIIGVIVSIYILIDKENLKAKSKRVIYSCVSKKAGNKVLDALEYVNRVFGGFVNGKIIDSIVIGVMTGLFCGIVDMPYAMLVSVIIGVTNIIPFFGPFIGAIPSAFLILVESPQMALIFIIFILVLQQVDANLVQPMVLGDSTGLSGLGVLLAIIVGSNLFGFVGMILAVPGFAIIMTILTFIQKQRLKKRGLTSRTEYYVNLKCFDEDGVPIRGERTKPEKPKKYHYMLGFLNKKRDKDSALEKKDEFDDTDEEPEDYSEIEDAYSVIEESEEPDSKESDKKSE
ncbi:MAG: AI-2E family transporter [Eubacterium sp.]|nr:AI-2E family transporter [Eubacterium sp.]